MSEKFIIKKSGLAPVAKIDYASELNEAQLKVVAEGDGPCLVLAGAGSGKTRTIVYRVAYLIEKGIDPQNILLLTFTNKASKEMLNRVESLLGNSLKGIWGGTFHSVAHRILRQFAQKAGYQKNFTILDQEDSRGLVKACLKDLNIDVKARRFPSATVLQSILSFVRNMQTDLGTVLETKYLHFVPLHDDIEKIGSAYARKKHEANALDFDDLLQVFLDLLASNQEVRERLSSQFKYVLVDEYQDTNPIQAEIVRLLSAHHKNVLVVGDDAQSIYSFRGADIRNILNFPKIFPDTKIFRLEVNYRSTPEILNVANNIIAKNQSQFKKILQPVKESSIKPKLAPASSSAQEAEFITEMILTLRDEGVNFEKIAVLFRATHHSQMLEMELTKRGIPYEYRGGMKFFERAHIKDVLAFLRVADNPKDSVAWTRVLNLQAGIGGVTATRIADFMSRAESLKAALDQNVSELLSARSQTGWASACRILKILVDAKGPNALISRVAASEEYRRYLELEYPNWQDRIQDLEQLATFSEKFEDTTQFLGEVSLFDDYGGARTQGSDNNEEKIVLSTIHQAKGLEWDTVFIMRMTAEDFPNRRAALEEGGIEEERRLFYVASTRAERQLFLSYPLTAGYYDNLTIQQPSPFLEEIDKRLLEDIDVEEEWDEPVIEIDNLGEEKPRRRGFLSSIDDL